MSVLGKKITVKALNPVMHSFVTIAANRTAFAILPHVGAI